MTGDLTVRAKILQLPDRRDRHPAHTGMTDTLNVMFGNLRNAVAAHDDI
jgi:hypothetical protein